MATDRTFQLRYAPGIPGADQMDFRVLQAAGAIQHVSEGAGGLIQVTFAAPFTDLVLVEHETLSPEKAARLREVMRHFGVRHLYGA